MVKYLPVGSEQATRFYAGCALEAGVGFVNNIPVFIASDPAWAKRFADKNLPIIGDDIKAQVGATIVHRSLVDLFRESRAHLSIKHRRQHRFPEHAEPYTVGLEEDLQDGGSSVCDGRSASGRKYPYRTERLRSLATRQQN